MSDLIYTIDDFYTAVEMGDLQKVKRIDNYVTSLGPCKYLVYNLLSVSLLHNHMDISRYFVNNICGVLDDDITKNCRGDSVLHTAVLHGDSSLVKLILKWGAFHTSTNIDGLLPLHLIVYRNPDILDNLVPLKKFDEESSKIIDVLLEFGVKINAIVRSQTKFGYTCLHLAAECGNERIIPILLKKYSDINAETETGLSPLHVAVINGNSDIMELLLENGAELYKRDKRGLTPFCWSIKQERLDMMEILLNFQMLLPQEISKDCPTLQNVNSCFLTAVTMNKPSIVEFLLKKGANVNVRSEDGGTALHFAAKIGANEIVQLLLDYGADVTIVGRSRETALYCAIERNWTGIVKILLNHVPEINSVLAFPSAWDITPLQLAVSEGCVDIVKLLLDKGNSAVINPQSGEYPLHTAIIKNRVKVLKLLLESGVDVSVRDMHGNTALQIAVYRGSLKMVQEVCRMYSKRGKKWKDGNEALYMATFMGRIDIVKFLLKEGADLNARVNNCLPLCAAAENGHLDVLKVLLAKGVNVNKTLNDGRSALIFGVKGKFFQIIECLLQNGADVNLKVAGNSSLHFAAAEGNIQIVKLLVSNGADVNAKNLSNATPLCLAIQNNFKHTVKYLIKNGADVNIANQDYIIKSFKFTSNCCIHNVRPFQCFRPLIIAVDNCNLEIVQKLLESGAPADIPNERVSPLHIASANGSLEIVKELIKFGANMNSICEQNYTAFSHAIVNGELETFMYLFREGVQFDRNSRKNELIHIALTSRKKNEKIVEYLLDHGISAKTTNSNNETALHCAISFGNVQGTKTIFRLLLNYGSDINSQDNNGNTPIHIAAKKGDLLAAKVLLEYEADINVVNFEGKTALTYLVDVIEHDLILYLRNIISCKYSSVAKLIVRVIALRESVGRIVDDVNLVLLKSEKINSFYERCKQELSQMKCRKLDKKVTLYDILTTNENKLASYMRNESIRQNLMLDKRINDEFKCYATMVQYRIKIGVKRKKLMFRSENILTLILKFQFPILVVYKIFSYLSCVDLENMSRAFLRPG